MKNPLVSICIPNYNYGKFIESAIKSAASQTYKNIEIIVVDNDSTDDSHQIIVELSKSVEIKYFRNNSNIGMVPNFNKCKDLSSGEYLVFLSADDILLPDYVSHSLELFLFENVGMVAAHCNGINNLGEVVIKPSFYNKSAIILGSEHSRIFLMTGIYFPSQVLIKRSLLNSVGGWNNRFPIFFDWNMWFKLSQVGDVGYIKDSLVLYREHEENASSSAIINMQMIFEKYLLKLDFFDSLQPQSILISSKNESIRKLADNCLFYSGSLIKQKNFLLAKKYIDISSVFDPEIINNEFYKLIEMCLRFENKDPSLIYEKIIHMFENFGTKRPFDVPPNSIII